jgi:hypothetical protein
MMWLIAQAKIRESNQLCKDLGALLFPNKRKIRADQAAGNDRRGLVADGHCHSNTLAWYGRAV